MVAASKGPRALGIVLGRLPPGPGNAISDVAGVRIGHVTLRRGEGPLRRGRGPVRTGVTTVLPHSGHPFLAKAPAAAHVINGFGKAAGLAQVQELGTLETAVLLTNTLNVGRAADALVAWMCACHPEIGVTTGTVNPVVLECNDGWLNDIQGRHVDERAVHEALRDAAAAREVAEGAVGAGTGMVAYGWKGGIGTASRVVGNAPGHILGTLVLANFGRQRDYLLDGVPVGRYEAGRSGNGAGGAEGDGSVIVLLATDAPLESRQLLRLARRAVVGLARTGAMLAHGSGDMVLAWQTAWTVPHAAGDGSAAPVGGPVLADASPSFALLLEAAIEATEEAVHNALFAAETTVGRDGHTARALPAARALAHWRRARRAES